MDSVPCDQRIIKGQHAIHALSNGLLTVVKVTEAPNKFLLVKNIAVYLHLSHSLKLSHMPNNFISCHLNLHWDPLSPEDVSTIVIVDLLLIY